MTITQVCVHEYDYDSKYVLRSTENENREQSDWDEYACYVLHAPIKCSGNVFFKYFFIIVHFIC